MLTQLVLTVKKTYEKGEHLPPPFVACFDTSKIAFVPFHDILPIFSDTDVNWSITPSNHTADDFLKTKKKIEKLSKKNIVIFDFDTDKKTHNAFTARYQRTKRLIFYPKTMGRTITTVY